LNRRESGQWNHCNSDITKWRQRKIVERVAEEAKRIRVPAWALFDLDEKLLVQGV
jgi:hypothetical protein